MKRSDYTSTRDEVLRIDVPAKTRTYKPVSNAQLIDLTLNTIATSGFKVDKETYTTAADGQISNGRYTLSNIADKEMQIQIGWQNSYNRQISLKFAIGVEIMICANGCVSGDMGTFKKKHQGDVQEFTPQSISEYIKSAGRIFTQLQDSRESMKEISLSKRQQAELLGRLVVEDEIISTMQLNLIRKEIVAPSHDYGAPDSLWELYQHTTLVMRELHPADWMTNHINAHSFFVNAQGELISSNSGKIVTDFTSFEEVVERKYTQLELSM